MSKTGWEQEGESETEGEEEESGTLCIASNNP